MAKKNFLCRLAMFASFFALGVIALGAFTRLIDAGLGCPDWPGCYGHLTAPLSNAAVASASTAYPGLHVVEYKAWAEMMHRYFVSALSIFILLIIGTVFTQRSYRTRGNCILAVGLALLLVYQILLGQWTVTLKLLPVIVAQHLLGGFFILSVLWLIYLNNNSVLYDRLRAQRTGKLLGGALVLLLLVIIQIALGAWTSTNYASLSCADFPMCVNEQNMIWHLGAAFNLTAPVGVNYEGGVLPESIRQTIQMTHRLGALVLTLYIFGFGMYAATKLKKSHELMKSLYFMFSLLCIQLCIGITNVIYKLPLVTAISHNLVAVLLLLTVITFIFKLSMTARKARTL